jgi:hypothetical protein
MSRQHCSSIIMPSLQEQHISRIPVLEQNLKDLRVTKSLLMAELAVLLADVHLIRMQIGLLEDEEVVMSGTVSIWLQK